MTAFRRLIAGLIVVLAVGFVLVRILPQHRAVPVGCVASDGTASFPLDPTQAANAATIAEVAASRGLNDHAVSVALAAALQESKLRNLQYGDRDSVGLFQQRPSQGWGPRQQLLDPHYAAAAFYRRLVQVPGWASLPIADAVQAVQRSADGSAYANWDLSARVLAKALTGEVPRGLACALPKARQAGIGADAVRRTVIGRAAAEPGLSVKRRWAIAAALVAQAEPLGLESVSFAGYRWTRRSGSWAPATAGADAVTFTVVTPG